MPHEHCRAWTKRLLAALNEILQFPTAFAFLHRNGSFEEMLSYVLNSLQVKMN